MINSTMNPIIRFLLGLLCAGFCSCSDSTPSISAKKKDQAERLQEVREMSAKALFEKNAKTNKIIFYAVGSESYGCDVVGLTSAEVDKYVKRQEIPVVILFSDDPAPLGATDEFWKEARRLVGEYNALVLKQLANGKSNN